MNNEAIAAHLSRYLPLSDRGAHQQIFLSISNSWSLVPVEQRKWGTNSSIYPRNGLDLLNEILETGLGWVWVDRMQGSPGNPFLSIIRQEAVEERIVFWNLIVEGVERAEKR